jgi:hypothetical protein
VHRNGELTIRWPTSDHANDTPPPHGNGNGDGALLKGLQPQTGRHGRQPDGTVPPLPRRRRQANLSPQLVGDAEPDPRDNVSSDADSVRMAEQARDTMAAFQHGTRQARDVR